MKKIVLLAIFFALHKPLPAQQKYLIKGEKISYNVHYGIIKAGEFNISVDTAISIVDSRHCYKTEVEGHTIGAVGLFSKINDVFTSYIDTTHHLSHKFVRNLQENNYTLYETTEFDRESKNCIVSKRTGNSAFEVKPYSITEKVQDIVSTYFAMRNLPFEKIKKNDTLAFYIFFEDTTFQFKIKCLGHDKIRTRIGKYKALVFSPLVLNLKNSIFVKDDPIKAWITDDAYRIPLKIQAKTKYGAVEADISNYNLFNTVDEDETD